MPYIDIDLPEGEEHITYHVTYEIEPADKDSGYPYDSANVTDIKPAPDTALGYKFLKQRLEEWINDEVLYA